MDASPNVEEEDNDNEEIYEQPPPGPSLGERHVVDEDEPTTLTAEQEAEAGRCLRSATLFQFCSDESIQKVVKYMRREQFSEGEVRWFFVSLLLLLLLVLVLLVHLLLCLCLVHADRSVRRLPRTP